MLLRASTHNVLNDVERALDDGCNTYQAMTRDGRFLPGAAALDIELSRQIVAYGNTVTGLEQYAVKAYGKAFEAVPHILADNAGLNPMDTIASLYAAHEGENGAHMGFDINTGAIINATETGILDLHATRSMAIRLSTDVSTTILRVDKIIQAKRAGGPSGPSKQGHWDDDD